MVFLSYEQKKVFFQKEKSPFYCGRVCIRQCSVLLGETRGIGFLNLPTREVEGDIDGGRSRGGGGEHVVNDDGFDDGAKSPGTESKFDGLVNDVVKRFVIEGEVDVVDGEEFDVLAYDGVFRFRKDSSQGFTVKRVEVGDDGQSSDDFGYESELAEVLRRDVLQEVIEVDVFLVLVCVIADSVGVETMGYFSIDTLERPGADKEDVARVNGYHLLFGVLASALRRNIDDRAFKEFEQSLLHAFTRDIARDGWIVTLARDFVNFVDKDNACLRSLHVIIGDLEESRQHGFNVFTNIASLCEDSGVDDGEGYVESSGDSAREECLAGACGTDEEDVGLFNFNVVVVGLQESFVVVIDGDGEVFFCFVLSDDVLVKVVLDLDGGGQGFGIEVEFVVLRPFEVVVNNGVGGCDAVVADEGSGTGGDEESHIGARSAAEGAMVVLLVFIF